MGPRITETETESGDDLRKQRDFDRAHAIVGGTCTPNWPFTCLLSELLLSVNCTS